MNEEVQKSVDSLLNGILRTTRYAERAKARGWNFAYVPNQLSALIGELADEHYTSIPYAIEKLENVIHFLKLVYNED